MIFIEDLNSARDTIINRLLQDLTQVSTFRQRTDELRVCINDARDAVIARLLRDLTQVTTCRQGIEELRNHITGSLRNDELRACINDARDATITGLLRDLTQVTTFRQGTEELRNYIASSQELTRELHRVLITRLDQITRELHTIPSSATITGAITTALTAQRLIASPTFDESATDGRSRAPDTRTFFGSLDEAIAATNAILSNVPNGTYDVAQSQLPVDQLYGQLHALHANNVKWFKHLEDAIYTANQNLSNRHQDTQRAMERLLSGQTETLIRELRRVLEPYIAAEGPLNGLASRLEELSARLPQLSGLATLEDLTRLFANFRERDPPDPNEANSRLPPYEAVHPTLPCRTHGVLHFDNVHTRIPMDLVSRPPSTSLSLTIAVRPTATHTEITAALYDAGALITSKHFRTPHSLTNLPGDALALFHRACPNFSYKLARADAC